MSLLSRKRCQHCGGVCEIKTYPEGDTEEKCLICGRVDGSEPVPDFVLEAIKLREARGKWNLKEKLGEIKGSEELGYRGRNKYIWHACVDCGRERWVIMDKGQPKYLKCIFCSNKVNTKKGRGGGCRVGVG